MDSVTICNLALGLLGIPAIASLNENNNNAKLCRRFYPVLRDRVLRDHPWSFAVTSAPLQQLKEKPFDKRFQFACALPGDLIRVVSVEHSPYRRVGKKIFTNIMPANVTYIRRVEDSGLFDDAFIEALQYRIAVEMVGCSTRDSGLIQFYRREYERVLALARAIDSQENCYAYQRPARRSSWLEARHEA